MPGSSRKMFLFGVRTRLPLTGPCRLLVVHCGNLAHEFIYLMVRYAQIFEDINHGSFDSSLKQRKSLLLRPRVMWCPIFSPLYFLPSGCLLNIVPVRFLNRYGANPGKPDADYHCSGRVLSCLMSLSLYEFPSGDLASTGYKSFLHLYYPLLM